MKANKVMQKGVKAMKAMKGMKAMKATKGLNANRVMNRGMKAMKVVKGTKATKATHGMKTGEEMKQEELAKTRRAIRAVKTLTDAVESFLFVDRANDCNFKLLLGDLGRMGRAFESHAERFRVMMFPY